VAVHTLSSGLLSGAVGGILGLAFQTIAATNFKPFWQALADGGQLTNPEMGFFITRFNGNTSATSLEPGGTFTLGGTDPTWYTGKIEFLDLASTASYWLLSVAGEWMTLFFRLSRRIDDAGWIGMTVQGKSVSIATGKSALAAIDTGATLIGGPSIDVQAIWAAVGGTASTDSPGFYQFRTFSCYIFGLLFPPFLHYTIRQPVVHK
jgi:cathepsin D